MAVLPGSLALTTISDNALAVASDLRNNFTAIQTAQNALLGLLDDGVNGQLLQGAGSTLSWVGDYTAFTPTWTSTGTAPAIGNGTMTGRYVQLGKFVQFRIDVAFGTTSTFGTGSYFFSLPVTAQAASGLIGVTLGFDNSGAVANHANAYLNSTTNVGLLYPATWPTGVLTNYAATAPWTWATSDLVRISGTYEAV